MIKQGKWILGVKVLVVLICFIIIEVGLYNSKSDKKLIYGNLTMEINISDLVYTVKHIENVDIFETSYQDDIEKLIYNQRSHKLYKADNPLMVLNPYGTNLTGIYIYFQTFSDVKIEYTISVDDVSIPDYTNTLSSSGYVHEGQIIGLVQGMENNLTIKLIEKKDKVKEQYEYKINVPDFKTNSIKQIHSKMYVDGEEIEDGLYMVSNIKYSDETGPMKQDLWL